MSQTLWFNHMPLHWEIRAEEKEESDAGCIGKLIGKEGPRSRFICFMNYQQIPLGCRWYRDPRHSVTEEEWVWDTKGTERCIMNINTSVNKALKVPFLYWSLKGTYVSKWTWTGSLLNHNLLKADKLLSSGERSELQYFPEIGFKG